MDWLTFCVVTKLALAASNSFFLTSSVGNVAGTVWIIAVVNANFGTSNQSNTYDNSLGDGILGHLRMIAGTLNTSHLFKSNPQDNEPLRIGSVNNLNNINITVLVASTSTYSTYTDAANPDYLITLFFKEVVEE